MPALREALHIQSHGDVSRLPRRRVAHRLRSCHRLQSSGFSRLRAAEFTLVRRGFPGRLPRCPATRQIL
jgi:hypothetical protein